MAENLEAILSKKQKFNYGNRTAAAYGEEYGRKSRYAAKIGTLGALASLGVAIASSVAHEPVGVYAGLAGTISSLQGSLIASSHYRGQ